MDITETYIKMCEKAEVIQGLWKPNSGDFIWQRYTLLGDEMDSKIWTEEQRADITVLIQKSSVGTYWSATDKDGNERIFDSDEDVTKSTCIWLPRQDQLQEMIKGAKHMHLLAYEFACYFHGSIDPLYANLGMDNYSVDADNSMEQMWLAFVMKEKYNKVWLNGEWAGGLE